MNDTILLRMENYESEVRAFMERIDEKRKTPATGRCDRGFQMMD